MKKFIYFIVLCYITSLTYCKKKSKEEDPIILEKTERIGKQTFNTNCATCHGNTGEGDGPASAGINPRNFKKDKFKNGDDLLSIQKTIEEGVPGTTMVGWKEILSAEQIEFTARYVRQLIGKK